VLESNLEVLQRAVGETQSNSNSDESKQEGKYDTRGIEASYLAEGQAEQVVTLEEGGNVLRSFECPLDDDEVAGGSIITLTKKDDSEIHLFILPAGGGVSLRYLDNILTVITPSSPIANLLIGKAYADSITLPDGEIAYISDLE